MRGMREEREHSGQGVVNHYDVIKVGVIRGEHIDLLIEGSIYSINPGPRISHGACMLESQSLEPPPFFFAY